MPMNLAQKLIQSHLIEGEMRPGAEVALKVDQTLLQDVLGTLVMLELEAMGVERVKVRLAAQYVDHNLVQNDHMNPDEHLFLRSACRRFGVWYSRPGNCTFPASASRGRLSSARTAIRLPPDRSACWPSAPAESRWRSPWRASRCICASRRFGA